MKNIADIIIKPVISEKSLREAALGRYTFLVERHADKKEIKDAIHAFFNVDVKKVFTNIAKGGVTSTRFGRRTAKASRKKSVKKARVVLGKDQKIDVFEEAIKKK